MTPPRICPPPPERDCPLHDQRIDYAADEPLRRAVLRDRRRTRSMAELVWADINRGAQRPPVALPAPPPLFPPVPRPVKREENANG